MEIRLLNGGTARINLKKYQRRPTSKSEFQAEIGEILDLLYPLDQVFEEVLVPGEGFVFDFMVPSLSLVVECQGRQHDTFVPYFHGTRRDFNEAKHRDERKRRWCELNTLRLVEIPYGADRDGIVGKLKEG